MKINNKLLYLTYAFSCILAQQIPANLQDVIKSSGIKENDIKGLLENQQVENLLPDIDQQQSIQSEINNAPEIINEVIESNASINDNIDGNELVESPDDKSELDQNILSNQRVANINISSYFGYSTFFNAPEVFQKSEDFSIPPSYIIGPGDEIILMLWGDTEDVSSYFVSRDGYIFIPNIGQVFVNGLNLAGLEKKLKKILQKAYASISGKDTNSSTFFDVSLGSVILKPIRVFVMGEVSRPGVYEMKPSSSLFTSLYYFNGPTTSGTLRDIKLIRDGKEIGSIDFYDFLLTGKRNNDIQLQDNDVVFVSPRQKTITVSGEVRRQSIFELKEGESFSELENIFGGYLSTTYAKRIRLDRTIPRDRRILSNAQYEIIDLSFEELNSENKDFQLLDGDIFTFYRIGNSSDKLVSISGPVIRPGEYSIGEGLTISGLIEKADGLVNEDIYRDRVDLISFNSTGKENFISLNLDSVLNNSENHNLNLKTSDRVVLYTMSEMVFNENVSIEGFVLNPGEKPFRDGMTVIDLLFLGGGFENTERLNETYMERADFIRRKGETEEFELISFNLDSALSGNGIAYKNLKMGDQIKIFSKARIVGNVSKTVQINGYIKQPGTYPLTENMYLTDLIFLGSGLNDSIFSNSIIYDRADLLRKNLKDNSRELYKIDIKELINNNINNYALQTGDQVYVYSKNLFEDLESEVRISGFINNPGSYELHREMTLGDLILIAGGITNKHKNVKVEISRSNSANDVQVFYLDFLNDYNTMFKNNSSSSSTLNFRLMKNDLVNIYIDSRVDFNLIEITGEIKYPGSYVLSGKGEELFSIVRRAGGITKDANPTSVKITRSGNDILVNLQKAMRYKNSKYNFPLMDGDVINISRRTNTITIIGAVNTPGTYQYINGFDAKDYIKMAGGYSANADRFSTFVRHANGSSKKISILNSKLKVFDSSTIEVLDKGVAEPFSFTEYVTNLTSIYTDFIQAIAVISILGNQN